MLALDHRAAQGHFPGNPIIPGAVLLSEALQAIETGFGIALLPCQIKAAKFFNPVRPGDHLLIECSGAVAGEMRFACTVGGKTVLTAHIKCDALPTPK
jgi:3-hydroxymyristoyl/3-hydroxydecanoyl-(acyl carrier protein) dehydratase